VALGFGSGDVLRYQYRLDSTNADWTAPDDRRTVTYAGLAPGRYRFEVRALNSDGDASADPATVSFRVLAPLWQRWWVVSLVALALALVTREAYRYRVARLLDIANMRTHIATDLHDDIGANLTRIALLSEVARQTHDDAPLASVARIARESVGAMSDIVWAINPKRESLLDLVRRMRQHAEEIFTLRDIELTFDAPDTADAVKLGMDIRRDLMLIFKEAVSNAARHSRCSRVAIAVRIDGRRLMMAVVDNGAGFDTSRDSEGQGLASMRRRAERLGATLEIAAGAGAGTTVKLGIPI
jgi:signal transduction histidine kinase